MFLRDLYTSAKRRWYFVLTGLLLTAGMALGVFRMTPVSYEATASVALIPPPTAVISGDNPFLYMGGLEQALGVLTVKINSDSVREPIERVESNTSYAAARDASTSGPIVMLSSKGPTPESAISTLNRVLAAIPAALESLQDELKLPAAARITLLNLATDREATLAAEGRTRSVVVVLALGSAATLLLTGLADKLLIRRKGARGARRGGVQETTSAYGGNPAERRDVSSSQIDARPKADRIPVRVPYDRP